MQEIKNMVRKAVEELALAAGLLPGQILVLGCSTSEIMGGRIGKDSSREAGEAVAEGAAAALEGTGIYLASACCEHLNRAVVLEREAALAYALEQVSVIPQVKAGGAVPTAVYARLREPVTVEFVRAHAGLDIGATLIGMHLRHVAVPLRLSVAKIGEAPVTYAKTRPKYVGGPRAVYC